MSIEVTTDQLEKYMTANCIAIEKNNPSHVVKKTQFGLFSIHKDGFVSELSLDKHSNSIWIIKEY